MQSYYSCESCDAEFKIKHFMDDTYYEVNFCPFCRASIEEEEDDTEYDDE